MKDVKNILAPIILVCLAAINGYGQDKPAISRITDTSSRPAVFAPGIVSTPYEEWSVSFTPDGNTVYFSEGTIYMAVCYSKKINGEWAKPKVLSLEYYLSPEGVYSYKKDIERIFPPAAEYFTPTLSQIADDFFIEDLKKNLPNTMSVIARLKNTAPKPSVYLRSSFNENGDVVKNFVPVPPLDFSANIGLTYGYYGGIKLLNNFKLFASRHHISVYFMYPCYPLSLYKGSNKAIEMMAADFKDDLKIKILDKPGDAVLPDSLFYNTEYHLNPHGRELRTQRIISLFKNNHIGVFQ